MIGEQFDYRKNSVLAHMTQRVINKERFNSSQGGMSQSFVANDSQSKKYMTSLLVGADQLQRQGSSKEWFEGINPPH